MTSDKWPLHPNVMSYSIANQEPHVMNLHDWILSVDGKREGFKLESAGREWMMQRLDWGGWRLVEGESDTDLYEEMWAVLPSAGWSVADAKTKK